ncbi:O-antigen ligase family protein [Microbacterium gorillae]|uniref:O-antigen ligase family protein n=1 Tax=Microbacterium gorillae TaxID=1231063 RepID=UPI00058F08F4|nr:O-antigen ligase family protein [Microbacterium gorillae]
MSGVRHRLVTLLDSAEMARAYALAAFGVTFGSFAIEHTAGLVTLATMVTALSLLGIAILIVRRAELSPLRIVPTTVVLLVGWAGVSLFFPTGNGQSPASWLALVGYGLLAVVIAHVRDTLQTVRALGDVLRLLLVLSLGMEILSGILLDMPFPFLGIQGDIAFGGPIQGLFGTRNLLGLVAVIALITFVIELRTQSIGRGLGVASLILGGGMAALSSSPTVIVLAAAVALSTGALALVRHAPAARRGTVQILLGTTVVIGLVALWVLRRPITAILDAGSDFGVRAELWRSMLPYIGPRLWQGWGWRGPWRPEDPAFPYNAINTSGENHASALNAYMDVLLQLGAVGLALFLLMCGVALVRSWFVATERRSVLYAWTPLVLVTLLVDSLFESFTLAGLGWMMLVLVAVRAGQSRSWRERVDAVRTPGPQTTAG